MIAHPQRALFAKKSLSSCDLLSDTITRIVSQVRNDTATLGVEADEDWVVSQGSASEVWSSKER